MVINVIKRDGEEEPFEKNKIVDSIVNAGAPKKVAKEIASEVEDSVGELVSTEEIRNMVLARLKKRHKKSVEEWINYETEEKARANVCPLADIYHDGEKYTFRIDLPGVSKDEIDFKMTENAFCLTAPKKATKYCGCWTLHHKVDIEKAKAKFEDGELTVTVPLVKSLEGKKIEIE